MWDFLVGLGKVFWVLFQVIVLFNLLIVVHELGHYWAAKWRGLKVEKFQIWFGKPLWKKEINGVQWGLGSIPLGGFVALPQMAPMESIEGGSGDRAKLAKITPLDKIIVAFAGPLFSMLLAFVFALLVWGVGKPSSVAGTTKIVGTVSADYPAAEVLQPGDEILSVDGVEVNGFGGMVNSITERIVFSTGEKITMKIQRPGEDGPRDVQVGYKIRETKATERPDHRRVGISPAQPSVIASVMERSPAEEAGLQTGDVLVSANGEKIFSPIRLIQLVEDGKGAAIALVVERGEGQVELNLVPRKPKENAEKLGFQSGIVWNSDVGRMLQKPGPPPLSQIGDSATAMYRTLKGVTSKDSDVGVSHMSSAVGIGGLYYDALSEKGGWRFALVISVLINVNLAILNLLPLPVLDGGHITMALYEWIRKKPLNVRVLEYVQVACALLLFGFIIYVSFFDIGDQVRKNRGTTELVW